MIFRLPRKPRMPIGFWGAAAAAASAATGGVNLTSQSHSHTSNGSFLTIIFAIQRDGRAAVTRRTFFGDTGVTEYVAGEWFDPPTADIGGDYQFTWLQRSSTGISIFGGGVNLPQNSWASILDPNPPSLSIIRTTVGTSTEWVDIALREAVSLTIVAAARITLTLTKT